MTEITVGASPQPKVSKPLTRTDFVRYQGASGDMNPIHHDELFAQKAGFPSVFAVGMLAAGVLGGFVSEWLGAENVRRFTVQFREQAWPDDVLTYTAEITGVREENGQRLADVSTQVTRQTGGVHIKGTAVYLIPGDG